MLLDSCYNGDIVNFVWALVFSLISVIGYSVISIYIGKVAAKHGAFWTSFWIQVLGLPLTLLFAPFFGLRLTPDVQLLPLVIFGIGMSIVFLLYSKNLSIGPVSVVQSLLRLTNVLIFILAVVFLHERITLVKIMSSLIMISGSVLVSLDIGQLLRKRIRTLTKAAPTVLLQIVLQAIVVLLLGFGIRQFGGFSANVGGRLFLVPVYLLMSVTRWRARPAFTFSSWKLILFITVVDVVAFILYTSSVQLYELSFSSMIQSTLPVLTAILGALFFGERLNRMQKLGIAVAVFGTMGLASGL